MTGGHFRPSEKVPARSVSDSQGIVCSSNLKILALSDKEREEKLTDSLSLSLSLSLSDLYRTASTYIQSITAVDHVRSDGLSVI